MRLLAAQAREAAVAIAWCRGRWGGAVGLAGISLGSFVAQLVARHADCWPVACRPDAVLLLTHHGRLGEALRDSTLAKGIGIGAALAGSGWTAAALAPWLGLADPLPAPAIPADRVVSLLADADTITPYSGGVALVAGWRLPALNRFVVPKGHFTAALTLARDHAPMRRAPISGDFISEFNDLTTVRGIVLASFLVTSCSETGRPRRWAGPAGFEEHAHGREKR